jgi:hypothetical protein
VNAEEDKPENIDYVIISLVVLLSYFIAYSFRFADDNTLTSWYWVFQEADAKAVFVFIVLGILASYGFTRTAISDVHPVGFLFILSFILGALFWRSPEVIIDASRYFTDAKSMAGYGVLFFLREWGYSIPAWTDLPAMPFFYGLIFKFLGESRVLIQFFNTLLFALTVVLTYKIGERLWSRSIGFYGGFLLLGFPYLFTQVPLMLVDVPTMFFLTLTIYACIEAMERGNGYIALAAIAVFLAFYSKFSTWLMLSVVPVIFLIYIGRDRDKIKTALAIALLALPLVGAVALFKMGVIQEQLDLLRSYQRPMLRVWTESYTSTFIFQIHPLVSLAVAYSLYAALRRRDLNYLIISWLLVLVLVINVRRIRYILPIFPMFALMASYGLNELRSKRLRKFTASCIVASSMIIALLAFLPFLMTISTVNLKEAGTLVNALEQETVEVYTLVPPGTTYNPSISVPIFDLFTEKRIIYEDMAVPPARERIERHPLRFTWDYKPPPLYTGDGDEKNIILVISPTADEPIPWYLQERLHGYQEYKTLDTVSKRRYNYRTVVRIYVP